MIKNFLKTLLIPSDYVSEIDCFIAAFDKQHPKLSLSQRQQKEKHARIYRLRDTAQQEEPSAKQWENF